MTRILILGDTHGDAQFISNVHRDAKKLGVNTIIQLGDFGFDFNRNTLSSIFAWLDGDPTRTWYWLDGNHDQHDYIEETILDGYHSWDSPVSHFHDRMFYCPRGSTTHIGSKKVLFLGGAYSIDEHRRTPHVSWWPQEMIRYSDVCRAIDNGTDIDVMLTHDTPPTLWIETELERQGYKTDAKSFANRKAMGGVVDAVRPQELYHGHFHWRYETDYRSPDGWIVKVQGVGANISADGWRIDHTARHDENYVIRDW